MRTVCTEHRWKGRWQEQESAQASKACTGLAFGVDLLSDDVLPEQGKGIADSIALGLRCTLSDVSSLQSIGGRGAGGNRSQHKPLQSAQGAQFESI